MKKAAKKEYIIKHKNTNHFYVNSKEEKVKKVSDRFTLDLHNWIYNHPHAIPSPTANNCIKVKTKHADGWSADESCTKILLHILIWEVHSDSMKDETGGG